MERLTKRVEDGNAVYYLYGFGAFDEICALSECVDRLAAYEDTGLKPDEITTEPYGCVFYCNRKCNLDGDFCAEGPGCPREIDAGAAKHLLELAQAEKDGRLVVLPCRVGDTVYIPLRDGVHGVRVMGIRISASGKDTVLHLDIGSGKFRWGSDKGRTWFSIQKEAEAALKKREEADDEVD